MLFRSLSRWAEEMLLFSTQEYAFISLPEAYSTGSSAMRVAPLGAFFADDIDAIPDQATLSSTTTHTHSEAVAGAIAVAIASALAWRYGRQSTRPEPGAFLTEVAQRSPDSAVRNGIEHAANLSDTTTVEEAVAVLGNGRNTSAPDTVPFSLWNAARHLGNYEEALWSTVAGLGDRDTTCAITGGIVVMFTGAEGIPGEWSNASERIPTHMSLKAAIVLTAASFFCSRTSPEIAFRVLNRKCGSICRRNAFSCALESSSFNRAVSVSCNASRSFESRTWLTTSTNAYKRR